MQRSRLRLTVFGDTTLTPALSLGGRGGFIVRTGAGLSWTRFVWLVRVSLRAFCVMGRAAGVLSVCVGLWCVSGCEKALFPATQPRTPYERYQRLHGQGRSASEENAYGGQQPALRDRLRPLGE